VHKTQQSEKRHIKKRSKRLFSNVNMIGDYRSLIARGLVSSHLLLMVRSAILFVSSQPTMPALDTAEIAAF
jgi:hypothetical protein